MTTAASADEDRPATLGLLFGQQSADRVRQWNACVLEEVGRPDQHIELTDFAVNPLMGNEMPTIRSLTVAVSQFSRRKASFSQGSRHRPRNRRGTRPANPAKKYEHILRTDGSDGDDPANT